MSVSEETTTIGLELLDSIACQIVLVSATSWLRDGNLWKPTVSKSHVSSLHVIVTGIFNFPRKFPALQKLAINWISSVLLTHLLEMLPNCKILTLIGQHHHNNLSSGSASTVLCHHFNSTCSISIHYYVHSIWKTLLIWHTCLNESLTESSLCTSWLHASYHWHTINYPFCFLHNHRR